VDFIGTERNLKVPENMRETRPFGNKNTMSGCFQKIKIGSKSTIFEGQKSKPLPPELLDLALYGSHQLSNHLKRGRCEACKKGMKPVRK